MKIYDYQWAATFGMGAATAADQLVADGVDTALIRNQIDPLPGSGVDQESYLASSAVPAAADREWTRALQAAGLKVLQTTAFFFEPTALETFLDARPVAANGGPHRGFDWYLGICPTHEGYLEAKIDRLRQVVAELEPDGMFLSFTRFPGFWENWVPGYVFTDADRYCFCDRCRRRFAAGSGVKLPAGDVVAQARYILDQHGEAWTGWRCAHLRSVIDRIASALCAIRPKLEIVLNTLPFPTTDFAGLDVRREIVAQDLALLRRAVDRFELMTYLQILARGDDWLVPVLADARRLAPENPLLCTLQAAPLYTEGIHAGRGRATEITPDQLDRSARAALAAGADGLVFYHWTDFLADEAAGGRKRAVLRGLSYD
jgi:hypothetical protein